MGQGGARLSREGRTSAFAHAARDRAGAPTRLGLTLRSVVLVPREGFRAAMRTSERRARAGERPAAGYAPYVLAAVGGAAVMALWLKLSALARVRAFPAEDTDRGLVIAALALGALLGLAGQAAWGALGPLLARRLGTPAEGRDLRLAWGAAVLPLAIATCALLPLDLLLVGPAAFATDPPADPVARAWAALSIALTLSAAMWSAWLFLRGVQVAADVRLRRAVVMASLVPVTAAALAAALLLLGALSA